MANNLHISYDLATPANYDAIIGKIKTLGNWAKIEYSFWYIDSSFTAKEAKDVLRPFLKNGDKLYVVDSTNNAAAWFGLSEEVSMFIRSKWVG